ncbi:TadE/TadG family type IV pilus assembly protein [Chloroflexota bacterium]
MRLKRHFSGQDLVEYALILPIMLIMIMGIFDLGRITFFYSTIVNISREGARFGVVHQCDDSGVKAAAKDKAIGIDINDDDIAITWVPSDCGYPDPPGSGTVTVSVLFDFTPMTPFIADILGGGSTITLDGTTTMYLEL